MSEKKKIVVMYSVVALIVVVVLVAFSRLGKATHELADEGEKLRRVKVADLNKELAALMEVKLRESIGKHQLLKLDADLKGVNQVGDEVSLQGLRGKVWVFAQFYGSCPECSSTNFEVLKEVYAKYKGNKNFQIVTVSVKGGDDAAAQQKFMKELADAYGADAAKWWFMSTDVTRLNAFCQEHMGYMAFMDNVNFNDAEKLAADPTLARGEIAHDMGISVYDAEMGLWAKVDLNSPMQQNDTARADLAKKKLIWTIDWCLSKVGK